MSGNFSSDVFQWYTEQGISSFAGSWNNGTTDLLVQDQTPLATFFQEHHKELNEAMLATKNMMRYKRKNWLYRRNKNKGDRKQENGTDDTTDGINDYCDDVTNKDDPLIEGNCEPTELVLIPEEDEESASVADQYSTNIEEAENGDVCDVFSCDLCEYKTKRKLNINKHVTIRHRGGRQPRIECDQCDHKAINKYVLKKHIKTVHEGLRYPCSQCDYKPTTKWNLNLHVATVHQEAQPVKTDNEGLNYICDHCNYKTRRKGNMIAHLANNHRDGQPVKQKPQEGLIYLCDQCDYKTTRKWNLKPHVENIHNTILQEYPPGIPFFSGDFSDSILST